MKITLNLLMLLTSNAYLAQQPTHAPGSQNNSPVDLSNPFDLIVFVILPLAMVIVYFLWRNQVKKDKLRENKNSRQSEKL